MSEPNASEIADLGQAKSEDAQQFDETDLLVPLIEEADEEEDELEMDAD